MWTENHKRFLLLKTRNFFLVAVYIQANQENVKILKSLEQTQSTFSWNITSEINYRWLVHSLITISTLYKGKSFSFNISSEDSSQITKTCEKYVWDKIFSEGLLKF